MADLAAMPFFKLAITLLFFELETFAYLVVNRLSARLRSVELFTPADAAIPMRLRSLWAYLSFVPYCLLVVFDFGTVRRMLRVFVCVFLNSLVAYRSFLGSPSAYPRPRVHVEGASRLERSWRALHAVDRPGNTFPSLHVSHAFLLALMMAHHVPRERTKANLLWASVIALSTLLTKQHYLVDVSGGILVAETIVSEVYEPWADGRLRVRTAFRNIRKLCERLDGLAASPADYRLPLRERHRALADLLGDLASKNSFQELYACIPGRHVLFTRKTLLVAFLARIRGVLSVANAIMPGWLQFIRDLQAADAHLTDDVVRAYLEQLDGDLIHLAGLVFELPPHHARQC